MASLAEIEAMERAVLLARTPGVPAGPNPRVGCVLLAPDGSVLAEGFHRGAGTPHAEADALAAAGSRARGATAVVTLEPCNHTGRTGPCAEALIDAGVSRVVFAQADPNPVAAGGAERLRHAGVDVEGGVAVAGSQDLTEAWTFAVLHGRPLVTWKVAASLDGRIAAADGTSRWISGEASRAEVHDMRGQADAIAVGTGTVAVDNPSLTARRPDGSLSPVQPLRVVVGERDIDPGCRVLDGSAPTLHLRTRDPHIVVAELARREVRHLLLEGGATVAAAFLSQGLVDRIAWYVAPVLLGTGPAALGDISVATLADAVRLERVRVEQVGQDARIMGWVVR